jgi:Na+-transporting NADH:ubiquinone oxidoreductase subunit C
MQQGNVFGMSRDSVGGTFLVALLLCLICAFLVSFTAVSLKQTQLKNQETFRKSKVLEVAQISKDEIDAAGGVLAAFDKRIQSMIIELDSGKDGAETAQKAMEQIGKDFGGDILGKYDQFWAAKSRNTLLADEIKDRRKDPAGLRFREKFSHVYALKSADGKSVERYIFPIRGNGLWGVMQGFVALEPDFKTVAGLTYYDHKETPGLGGEVDNPEWKKSWEGQLVYDEEGEVALKVVKGTAAEGSAYQIDGLSGATITGNGVNSMIQFWFGDQGFGPFINQRKSESAQAKHDENALPAVGWGLSFKSAQFDPDFSGAANVR